MINNICVFCGSSSGTDKLFEEQTAVLGKAMAKRNIGLVYGGANCGLMGTIADSVLQAGGKVTGVLPYFLQSREVAHKDLTKMILVETMHERKLKMSELSDAVIVLPGGFGTMEEFFEMITWLQLGLHQKPIAILNVDGFYDELIAFFQTLLQKGFISEKNFNSIIISNNVDDLLNKIQSAETTPGISKLSEEVV